MTDSETQARGEFNPSRAYSNYVLGLLFVVAGLNLADRQIFGMLIEAIKAEFGTSDTQLGLLTGFGYAVFHCAAGIPVARWADRGVRRSIVSLGLLVWSGLTVLQGFAQSFTQLFLARLGVGVGEAAGTPPSHSILSDYFPPKRRATALATMSVGSSTGVVLAYLAGGWINEFFGWRAVMIAFGVPGLLLAVLIRLTLREPPRGNFDALQRPEQYSLRETIGFLWKLRSYRHLVIGASLHSFAFAGAATWYPAFLMRVHGLSSGEAGTALALLMSAFNALGIYTGGLLADRLGARDVRWYMLMPAFASFSYAPLALGFLFAPGLPLALACLVPASFLVGLSIPGMHVVTQGLARPAMRSVASAINILMLSLIGTGLGPTISGILNDTFAGRVDEPIRYSLSIVAIAAAWSGVHKWISSRALPAEMPATSRA